MKSGNSARPSGGLLGWPCLVALLSAALAEALRWLGLARPDWLERFYARPLYPRLQGLLARTSALAPFSVGELLLLGCVLLGLAWPLRLLWLRRKGRIGRLALLGRLTRGLLTFAGLAYASFLLLWGWMHARAPIERRLGLEPPVEHLGERLAALERRLREEASDLRGGLPEDEQGVFASRRSLAEIEPAIRAALAPLCEGELGLGGRVVLRASSLSWLLSYLGVTGIYCPWTGESHVNIEMPTVARAFTAAHEAAHALGVAREDEANFVAWLACSGSSDPELRYSGAVEAMQYVRGEMSKRPALDPRIARDLGASHAFWVSKEGPLQEVTQVTNDLYLKSQGHAEGTRSYDAMVRLLLAWHER